MEPDAADGDWGIVTLTNGLMAAGTVSVGGPLVTVHVGGSDGAELLIATEHVASVRRSSRDEATALQAGRPDLFKPVTPSP